MAIQVIVDGVSYRVDTVREAVEVGRALRGASPPPLDGTAMKLIRRFNELNRQLAEIEKERQDLLVALRAAKVQHQSPTEKVKKGRKVRAKASEAAEATSDATSTAETVADPP